MLGLSLPHDLTRSAVLIITVYSFFLILVFWGKNIARYDRFHEAQPLLLIMIAFHLLFPFEAGDYYHMMESLHTKDFHALEPIYAEIASFVGYNYFLFRLVVWGGAFFLFLKTARRFGLDIYKTAFLLYAMFIGIFDYARASLAMSMFFYGYSFICIPFYKHHILSYVVGAAFMSASLFFHTSMAIVVGASVVTFIPFNKRTIIAGLLLLVISVPYMNTVLGVIVDQALGGGGRLNENIVGYANQVTEEDSYSTLEWVRRWVCYSTLFIPIIILGYKFFLQKNRLPVSSSITKLYKITVAIQIIALSTLMIDLNTFILFYRILYISMIPVIILFSYSRQHGFVSHRTYKYVIVFALLGIFFGYSKMILGGNI